MTALTPNEGPRQPASGRDTSRGGARRVPEDALCRLRAVALQLRLAEASAEVDAARALHRHDIGEMLDKARRGAEFTGVDRARYRRDKAFIARLCLGAVNRLFEAGRAHAILDSEPLQRFNRDAHAVAHHQALGWDLPAEEFGRRALGLAPRLE